MHCDPSVRSAGCARLIVCTAIAVDDIASASPATSAPCQGKPAAHSATPIAAPQAAICSDTAAEHRAAQFDQALEVELEADQKQHQHDAELGEVQDRLDVA